MIKGGDHAYHLWDYSLCLIVRYFNNHEYLVAATVVIPDDPELRTGKELAAEVYASQPTIFERCFTKSEYCQLNGDWIDDPESMALRLSLELMLLAVAAEPFWDDRITPSREPHTLQVVWAWRPELDEEGRQTG